MSNTNFTKLGELIKERRAFLNYNQKDIAELTQISERTIRAIEKGKGSSKIEYWWKILDVLGLEMRIQFKPISHETSKSV